MKNLLRFAALTLALGLGPQPLSARCWYVIDHYKQVCAQCSTCNWDPQPCIEVPVYRKDCDDEPERGAGKAKSDLQAGREAAQAKAEEAHAKAALAVEKALALLEFKGAGEAAQRSSVVAEARQALKEEKEAVLAAAALDKEKGKAKKKGFAKLGVPGDKTAKPIHLQSATRGTTETAEDCSTALTCSRPHDFSVCCPQGYPYYSGCDELCHSSKPWDCGDVSHCE
jgi:hypothetical protein